MTALEVPGGSILGDTARRPVATPGDSALLLRSLCFVLLGLALLLPGLRGAPLAGTEGHRSLTAHQMVESGEWLVPRLYGRLYLRKPPLHYWLIAIAEKIGGASELVWRMPSVLSASLTAGLVAFFGGRWFGKSASVASGFSCLFCVALWPQSKTAEIEADNTLVAVLGALCLIELYVGTARRPWLILLAGFACGATLLMKGPGGLMPIGGAMLAGGFLAWRRHIPLRLLEPRFWMPVLIGAGLAAAWAVLAWRWIVANGLTSDISGLREASDNLAPANLMRVLRAIALPPTLIAYTLPISLAIPAAAVLLKQSAWPPGQSVYVRMLLLTLLGAAGLGLVTGLVNPRYAYVYVPLVAPLAGAAFARLGAGDERQRALARFALAAALVVLAIAAIVLALLTWHEARGFAVFVPCAAILLCLAGLSAANKPRSSLAAACVAALLILVGLGYGRSFYRSRFEHSGFEASKIVRRQVGDGGSVLVGGMLRFEPELLYYAGVNGIARAEDLPPPDAVQGPQWVMLNAQEFVSWKAAAPQRMSRVTPFKSNKSQCYVALLLPKR